MRWLREVGCGHEIDNTVVADLGPGPRSVSALDSTGPPRFTSGGMEMSTSGVDAADAFDYWRDMICDEFVQLSARPRSSGPFSGHIAHRDVDAVQLSTVTAGAQQVDRTRSLIARSQEEFLLASIQLDGRGTVRQDGRAAELTAGSMAFYDSTRPYTLSFDGAFRQLVVQVPKRTVGRARAATAVGLDAHGPVRLVTDFFTGLAGPTVTRSEAAQLAPHAIGLLEFALGLAAGTGGDPAGSALAQRVRRAIADAAGDPDADADAVAAACGISRRTLFRTLAEREETFTGLVRAERVRRASALLRARPSLPVAAVATRVGFLGETQLHRAFRRETGTTPGRFRGGAGDGTDGR